MSNNDPRKRTPEAEVSAVDDNTQKIVAATNETTSASGIVQSTTENPSIQSLASLVDKPAKTVTVTPSSIQLGHLAAEIHIGIAERCEDRDLCALRLVCRSLSKDTTDIFAKRFFSDVECDISSDSAKSLARIQAISGIPEFCRHVKRVSFSMQRDRTMLSDDTPRMDSEVLHTLTQCFRFFSKANSAHGICISPGDDGAGFEGVSHAPGASRHHISSLSLRGTCFATNVRMPLESLPTQQMDYLCLIWSKLADLEIELPYTSGKMGDGPLRRLFAMSACLESLKVAGPGTIRTLSLESLRDLLPGPPLRKLGLTGIVTTLAGLVQFISAYGNTLKALELVGITIDSDVEGVWSGILGYLGAELQLTTFDGSHLSRLSADDVHQYCHQYYHSEQGLMFFDCAGTKEKVSLQLTELAERGYEHGPYGFDSSGSDDDLSLGVYEDEEHSGWSDDEEGWDLHSEEETSDGSNDGYE